MINLLFFLLQFVDNVSPLHSCFCLINFTWKSNFLVDKVKNDFTVFWILMSERGRILFSLILLLNHKYVFLVFFVHEKGEKSHIRVIIPLNCFAFCLFLNKHMIFKKMKNQSFFVVIFLSQLVLKVGNNEGSLHSVNFHLLILKRHHGKFIRK